ncbi:MAG: DUF4129 domain-containing protein, partial [Gaiellaceae bacterium]
LLPLGAIVVIWAWSLRRREALLRGGTNWRQFVTLLGICVILLPVALLSGRHLFGWHSGSRGHTPNLSQGNGSPVPKRQKPPASSNAQFQWLPALVLGSLLLGIGLTAGAALVLRRRQGEGWDEEAALAVALDEVLADSLDDLRSEPEPRQAVIRAYARMERTFAAYGVPRRQAEAPLEYVARVLDTLRVSAFSVRRLSQLFGRAKFSPHEIDAGMKEEAIDVLVALRGELEHERAAA